MAIPFNPPPESLPSQSSLEELLDFDWDTVESIADDEGWTWDDNRGAYFEGGNIVSPDRILSVTRTRMDGYQSQIRSVSNDLTSGNISVSEWERRVAEITVSVALIFFLLGMGSRSKITGDDTEDVKDRLRLQFDYLRNFSEEILNGDLTVGRLSSRAELYIFDAQNNYSLGQEATHSASEYPFYSNVLGSTMPCEQCPRETAKGIVPRGELISIGQRICLSRCYCSFWYYRTQNESQVQTLPLIGIKDGWIGVRVPLRAM